MIAALEANDILEVVTGGSARPEEPAAGADAARVEEVRQAIKAWIKSDAKARYLISAAMEPEQMVNLLICTTSKEMWDTLGVIHEQKSASHKLLISQRFHDYRMDPKDTVTQHVAKCKIWLDSCSTWGRTFRTSSSSPKSSPACQTNIDIFDQLGVV